MIIDQAFPSTFLKAADLQRPDGLYGEVNVVMDRVEMTDLGSEQKPVLYFLGKDKGLVLNKTNAYAVSTMHGNNTDHWQGQEIKLRVENVSYQGRVVPAIRVYMDPNKNIALRAPMAPASAPVVANGAANTGIDQTPLQPTEAEASQVIDDDIPF